MYTGPTRNRIRHRIRHRILPVAAAQLALVTVGVEAAAATTTSAAGTTSAAEMIVALPDGAAPGAVGSVLRGDPDASVVTPDLPGPSGTVLTASLTATEITAVYAAVPGAVVARDDRVSVLVEPTATATEYSWALDRIDVRGRSFDRSTPNPGAGAGVVVYVVDTGIRPTVEPIKTAPGRNFAARPVAGRQPVIDPDDVADCNGHGTHVASLVAGEYYGVAEAATVVPVRVLDCAGYGQTSDIVAGLSWIAGRHRTGDATVVNLSLGGPSNAVFDAAVDGLVSLGVIVTVAAGNRTGNACTMSPARSPHAVTVAASDPSDRLAWFSNYGSCIDLVAPGLGVPAAYDGTAVAWLSGTSMAAPLVAGAAAARWSERPGSTGQEISNGLLGNATASVLDLPDAATPNLLLYTGPDDAAPGRRSPDGFIETAPRRLLDTRLDRSSPVHNATFYLPVPPPDANVSTVGSVVLTITAVDALDAGHASIHPCGTRASTSLVNVARGETRATTGVFSIPDGGLCITVVGTFHIIADLSGWYLGDDTAGFVPLAPVRVADSRSGMLLSGPVDTDVSVLDLSGALVSSGYTTDDVASVWVNLTVVAANAGGHLSVGPCDRFTTATSVVNYEARTVVANGGLYPLYHGSLCVAASSPVDLVVDLTAVHIAASDATAPTRIADSRHMHTAIPYGPVDGAVTVSLPVALPESSAVVVNITAVDASAPGWISVSTCEHGRVTTSAVNYRAVAAVANAAVVSVGPSRTMCLFTSTPVQIIVDLTAVVV